MDRDKFETLLRKKQLKAVREDLTKMSPIEISQLLESVPPDEAMVAFRLLPKNLAVEAFDHLPAAQQLSLLRSFTDQNAKFILEAMPPDDRAELLEEVPAMVARKLLRVLSPEERQVTLSLLGYGTDTAGRVMTPFFVDLRAGMTAKQALDYIRRLALERETIYESYVMDDERRLLGTVSLKDLVLADPESRVAAIMKPNPVSVATSTDQEEVARVLRDHHLPAVPVVDSEGRLVGVITQDDVVDIVEQEATEDIYRFGAVTGTERGYFTSRILSVVRRRILWLFVLIIVNTVTGSIIAGHSALLGEIVLLAAFIPLLIGTGGNIGAQSATVIIRGLATREISPRRALTIIAREVGVGIIIGILLAVVVAGWAYLLSGSVTIALTVSITLMAVSVMGTLAGAALPFIFHATRVDPAFISAPFITTIMDIFGILLYFIVARIIIQF